MRNRAYGLISALQDEGFEICCNRIAAYAEGLGHLKLATDLRRAIIEHKCLIEGNNEKENAIDGGAPRSPGS